MVASKRTRSKTPRVKKSKPTYIIKPIKKTNPVILKTREQHQCQWCLKIFSSEKIVLKHMCEPRRRFEQKDTLHCRLGLLAFLEMQVRFAGTDHDKTEEDFRKSDYYLAYVRWGRYVIDVHCMNPMQYHAWLLKMKVVIDQWDNDEVYQCWLAALVFEEDAWVASERSMRTITEWAEENHLPYHSYFQNAGAPRILFDIQRAKITGWLIFNSEGGKKWLANLSRVDLESIWPWIDAVRWNNKLKTYSDEAARIGKICECAGL